MELQLKFALNKGNCLPINYQYPLSAWIYSVIRRSDAEYSTFLHNKGFQLGSRHFKMFTFSQLDLRPYEVFGNQIRLLGKEISLSVRFLVDSSLEHFIKGLFMNQRFPLGNREGGVELVVTNVETAAPVNFRAIMQYECLSPICVSRKRENGTAEYVSPADNSYGTLLIQNLLHKQQALAPTVESNDNPACRFRLLNTPRKKGIHIKAGTDMHTQVIGYSFRFELQAPEELHEIGYYAGFGEKNSMGFGCVKTRI